MSAGVGTILHGKSVIDCELAARCIRVAIRPCAVERRLITKHYLSSVRCRFVRAPLGSALSQQSYDHTNIPPDASSDLKTPTESAKFAATASMSKPMDRNSEQTFDERDGIEGTL